MSKYRDLSKITELIIHCAATPNGRHFTIKDIDNWHGERGFKRNPLAQKFHAPTLAHVGYHFVIDLNGRLACGRALTETGAHAKGHNAVSIGICLIGTDKFTPAQWQTLRDYVLCLRHRFPAIAIIGHNYVNHHKICPGFSVQDWLQNDMQPLSEHQL